MTDGESIVFKGNYYKSKMKMWDLVSKCSVHKVPQRLDEKTLMDRVSNNIASETLPVFEFVLSTTERRSYVRLAVSPYAFKICFVCTRGRCCSLDVLGADNHEKT